MRTPVGHQQRCARCSTWTRSSATSRRPRTRRRSPMLTLLKQARAFGLGVCSRRRTRSTSTTRACRTRHVVHRPAADRARQAARARRPRGRARARSPGGARRGRRGVLACDARRRRAGVSPRAARRGQDPPRAGQARTRPLGRAHALVRAGARRRRGELERGRAPGHAGGRGDAPARRCAGARARVGVKRRPLHRREEGADRRAVRGSSAEPVVVRGAVGGLAPRREQGPGGCPSAALGP
jgi:hypothetical protein